MLKLADKAVVVTGASKGIGAAIAKAFAAEGAAVVVGYRSAQGEAEAVVESIQNAGGRAVAIKADVASAADAEALIEGAYQQFGRLDVLVNNAGVYEYAPIAMIDEAHYRKTFDINVLGLLQVTSAAVKRLSAGGCVINISSLNSTQAPPYSSVYSASKAAVDAITSALAAELGPRGIRVNAIRPGATETEGIHEIGFMGSELEQASIAATPLGRLGQPDDIAGIAVFLASDDARWVSGEKITAAGGQR